MSIMENSINYTFFLIGCVPNENFTMVFGKHWPRLLLFKLWFMG